VYLCRELIRGIDDAAFIFFALITYADRLYRAKTPGMRWPFLWLRKTSSSRELSISETCPKWTKMRTGLVVMYLFLKRTCNMFRTPRLSRLVPRQDTGAVKKLSIS
jgi:hypothetical protein